MICDDDLFLKSSNIGSRSMDYLVCEGIFGFLSNFFWLTGAKSSANGANLSEFH